MDLVRVCDERMRVQKAIIIFVKERFILMKKYAPLAIISILFVSLLAACSSSEEAAAEDEESSAAAYYRSRANAD